MITLIIICAFIIGVSFLYKKISPSYKLYNNYGKPSIFLLQFFEEWEDKYSFGKQIFLDKDNCYYVRYLCGTNIEGTKNRSYTIDIRIKYNSENVEINMRMEAERNFTDKKNFNCQCSLKEIKGKIMEATRELEKELIKSQ